MATRITVKDNVLRAHLGKLQETLADMHPILEVIGAAVRSDIQLGFAEGRSPTGQPWKKPIFRPGGRPLTDTGKLSGGISYNVLDSKTVEIGTDVPWAHVHQYGAIIRPKRAGGRLVYQPKGFAHPIFSKESKIPSRPFLPEGGLPPSWRSNVLEVVNNRLQKLGLKERV